ncbi:MAG: hypothetical protein L3I99_01990 [Sulfurimonas sp.]|nr:hypothetical protein [Sulfurimonas sp.]
MTNFIAIIKELRLFMALLFAGGGMSVLNPDLVLEYIYAYNIHLAIITIGGIYINHFLSNRRHLESETRLDSHQEQLNKVILANTITLLKAEVRQAFKDYYKIEVIDFVTTIKYIQALDNKRIALGVNSYTEDMMKILLKKIKHER